MACISVKRCNLDSINAKSDSVESSLERMESRLILVLEVGRIYGWLLEIPKNAAKAKTEPVESG